MSEKVTFQELVDSIAEQSGKSKKFTHDFIKDWVSVINESLEKDGNINIAGLGKFELKKMDERDGFNPQTEEKITIPAHNKIVFKPYKDLRELVNAPYARLEPEIIEETENQQPEVETDAPLTLPLDSDSETKDPPEKKKAPWEEDMEKEIEVDEDDPFGLDAGRKSIFPLSMEDDNEVNDKTEEDDVVEYVPGSEPKKEEEAEVDDEIETGISHTSEEQSEEKASLNQSFSGGDFQPNERRDKTVPPVEEPQIDTDQSEEKKDKDTFTSDDDQKLQSEPAPNLTPTFRSKRHEERESEGNFWIIAAAFLIILLLLFGTWYFMEIQQTSPPDSLATQSVQNPEDSDSPTASRQGTEAQEDQTQSPTSSSPADNQQNAGNQQSSTNSQSPNQQTTPSVKTINIVQGQTLWGLADNEYNNPYLWPWIYDTNKSSIDDPNIIIIGQSLDIPLRSGTDNQLSRNDSLQVALGYVETYKWYKENNLENAKFYLYVAKKYHDRVFEYSNAEIDEADLTFANRAQ